MKELYIQGIRGQTIETLHRVHFLAQNKHGIVMQCGSKELVTPTRSAAKPFMVNHQLNLAKKSGIELSDKHVSLMVSSHNGEYVHRKAVEELLKLAQCNVNDLHCGTHIPFFDWLYGEFFQEKDEKRQLFHNCSGKHAGMLLLNLLVGGNKEQYWELNHPIQEMITSSVKDMFEIAKNDEFSIVLDGCGVPNYCVTLSKLASAYLKVCCDERLARIREAVLNEPYMIAGKDRVETDIIRNCGFFAKSGSDGVFCVTVPSECLSIVLKVEDGGDDAAESAIVEILSTLDLLTQEQEQILNKYRYLEIYTSTGELAGQLSPKWVVK